jgi:hypothetical protein
MNAAYWQVFFGRMRRGMTLITIILSLLAIAQMKGAEIVVTVTGDVVGGSGDLLHIFGTVRNLIGKPFTLVFTFDDSKGTRTPLAGCEGSASGVEGNGVNSPGKAVLTIGDKSFTFGTKKYSHSGTWREIASGCSQSHIVFEVEDTGNSFWNITMIDVNIHPADKGRSFTQNPDWRAQFATSAIDSDSMSGFAIAGPGGSGDGGIFSVKSIEISGPQKARPAGGR